MPLYDYICDVCGHEFETICKIAERCLVECPRCGKWPARQIIKYGKAPAARVFKAYLETNAAFEPHWIETPQQLRDLCDRNNAYSERLLDGPWRTSPGPDPDPVTHPEAYGDGRHVDRLRRRNSRRPG